MDNHSKPQLPSLEYFHSIRKFCLKSYVTGCDNNGENWLLACFPFQLANLNKLFIQIVTAVILIALQLENLDCWVHADPSELQTNGGWLMKDLKGTLSML